MDCENGRALDAGRDCNDPAAEPQGTTEALLHAACAGSREARQQLYAHCLPALQRRARRWLPRTHAGLNDADDLVQIALLRALQRIGEFEVRGAASFLAYLHRILVNEVRGELRRQRRRGDALELDENFASAADPVLDHVLSSERQSAYLSALRRLGSCQRQFLALRIDAGLSFSEIAARTGNSEDGARMRVARALRSMTRQLAAVAA